MLSSVGKPLARGFSILVALGVVVATQAQEIPKSLVLTSALDGSGLAYGVYLGGKGSILVYRPGPVPKQLFIELNKDQWLGATLTLLDEPTQIAHYQFDGDPKIIGVWEPVQMATSKDLATTSVRAFHPGGVIRGDLAKTLSYGVIQPIGRTVPLHEIRFESRPDDRYPSAFVFSEKNRLVGLMNSSLAGPSADHGAETFGPAGLSIGYALGTNVLQRVMDGFLSKSGYPKHPTLGMTFKNHADGVQVVSIQEDSPAGKAGLKPNDLILKVDGQSSPNAFQLGAKLFGKSVGDTVTLEWSRSGSKKTQTTKVTLSDYYALQKKNVVSG
jgi:S1-C subfamily serine protease